MTPAARAAAAIEILDLWADGDHRAEKVLRDWGRANRFAGSGDRRAIGDLVYTCIRRRRSLLATHGATGGRGLVLGLVLAEGADPDDVFTGAKYAPSPLSETERLAPDHTVSDPVKFDHPDWMEPFLKSALKDKYADVLSALQIRAPIGLRVNGLKTDRKKAAAALDEDGVETIPSPLDEDALIAPPGARIAMAEAYREGQVELQDPASQAVGRLAGAAPGETVLDYCAGGGGKALAFAAHMQNRGRLILHDVAEARLAQAQTRADRAGATVEIRQPNELSDLKGACDLVFVDAPCSGSGSWRRDPEGKWRLSSSDLAEYQQLQRDVFSAALPFVRPGGRIAYVTCSLFDEENSRQCDWFLTQFSQLTAGDSMILLPDDQNDGFFCQIISVN